MFDSRLALALPLAGALPMVCDAGDVCIANRNILHGRSCLLYPFFCGGVLSGLINIGMLAADAHLMFCCRLLLKREQGPAHHTELRFQQARGCARRSGENSLPPAQRRGKRVEAQGHGLTICPAMDRTASTRPGYTSAPASSLSPSTPAHNGTARPSCRFSSRRSTRAQAGRSATQFS